MRRFTMCLAGGLWLLVPALASAQNPTGTISGRVVDQAGLVVPGVTVTATSPNLQGPRTALTSENGDYIVGLLPPGTYAVLFELSGFKTVTGTVSVAPTETVPLDATMTLGAVSERVTVVGNLTNFVETAAVATKFEQTLVSTLPTNRTLDASVLMAPGVHPTGPNGNYSIGGAVSFENLFVLNGAVINENLRGQPQPLYIEDAIQEVTIATSGVSAEFGRFGGGLVTAVTKSGGNTFSGSYRASFNNDAWRTKTPIEVVAGTKLVSKVVPTHEYTIGGPISRDRLWFFTAGRLQKQTETRTTAVTLLPYSRVADDRRYEGKVTYSPRPGHTVKAGYLALQFEERGQATQNVMDIASLVNRHVPQDLLSFHYSGVLKPNFFVEAQYSGRHLTFKNSGSQFTDIIKGTLLIDRSRGGTAFRYNSPTFCGVCGGEKRDNDDIVVKSSYFASTKRYGAHSLVSGYDRFNEKRFSNNHQSGSDFRILGTGTMLVGTTIYPVFQSSTTSSASSTIIQNDPISVLSQGSNFRTHSLYVNDGWRASDRLTVTLGLRWDKNAADDAGGKRVASGSSVSPRAAATWDVRGNGVWSVTGSVARYAAAVATTIADVTSAGVPATFQYLYSGPSINTDPSLPLVPVAAAIQQAMDWFNQNGGTTRPFLSADIPGVATTVGGSLKSPSVKEVAGGVARQFGARGSLRADVTYRRFGNFYANHVDQSTGKVTNPVGATFDRKLIENTNGVERRHAGMTLQGTYRPRSSVDIGANYTLSRTWGNFDGESTNAATVAYVNYYPEYNEPKWNRPVGDLSIDQRHRMRLWGTYTRPLGTKGGTLSLGAVQQMGSGAPYGALGTIDTKPYVTNPGYAAPDGGRTALWDYFFTARDAFHTEATYRTDFALNYSVRPFARGGAELFIHAEILNLFNQSQLCACGGTVFNNGGGTQLNKIGQAVTIRQTFNPFTTTPVEGTNWVKGANFGLPVDRFSYTTPRVYRFNVGVRF